MHRGVPSPVIAILSQSALGTARRIVRDLPGSTIYSLSGRVQGNKNEYGVLSKFLQMQYGAGKPIIALCAVGIVIRSLAPLLSRKSLSSPVIVVAEDGSSVVPLLGVTHGVNRLAEKLALILDCKAAITTSGELRFGINLLYPPEGLKLVNRNNGKTFVSALLNGAMVKIEGYHSWFMNNTRLPISDVAHYVIRIFSQEDKLPLARANELIYQKHSLDRKGRVSIIGLGPGSKRFRTFSAEHALKEANDILGYERYVDLAGPFSKEQNVYKSTNKEEIARARHALTRAAHGRNVALVSSGDPGIYAMASAVFEVWEQTENAQVDIIVEPGISAAFAAAARFGAPLGHDFAVISLSDNLKSWEIIKKRLRLASQADLVLALYNPVSKARTSQLKNVVDILREERLSSTIIALAHDLDRKDEVLKITSLKRLQVQDITSRTVILVGSSKTRCFKKNGRDWVYTPRSYI